MHDTIHNSNSKKHFYLPFIKYSAGRACGIAVAACLGLTSYAAANSILPDPGSVGSGYLYTFTGQVTDAYGVSGFPVGTAVSYVFLVDVTQGGYVLTSDAGQVDLISTPDQLWFYASYQSGSALPTDPPSAGFSESFYTGSVNAYFSSLNGSNADLSGSDVILVSSPNNFSTWAVGQTGFDGFDFLNDRYGNTVSEVDSRLTLTSITAVTNPGSSNPAVPEPTGIGLLALGLLGVAVSQKKKHKAPQDKAQA